jgi:hypothetical protein
LYRYFVSQSNEFRCHNPLCCFSTSAYYCRFFRYRLSLEPSGYTLVQIRGVVLTHRTQFAFRAEDEYDQHDVSIAISVDTVRTKKATAQRCLVTSIRNPEYHSLFLSRVRDVVAQSVQRRATGWMIGVLEFDSRRGLGIFLFTTASRTALEPTQPPMQCVQGALSLGVKRPGREADHSPPSSAEVKECVELYLHSPNTPSWLGAQLKHRDNFTFYLSFLSPVSTLLVHRSHHCLDKN